MLYHTDRSEIVAPPIQVIQAGSAGSLLCSHPAGFLTWHHGPNDDIVPGQFDPATFADEGNYTCDIFIPASSTSTRVQVMLYIVG